MAFEAVKAEIGILLTKMQNEPEDRHELYLQLMEKLNELKAYGMPIPEDLAPTRGGARSRVRRGRARRTLRTRAIAGAPHKAESDEQMWPLPLPRGAERDLKTSLRSLTLAIGVIETLALVMFAALMLQSSDPLGAAIGRGITMLLAVPYVLLALPGMVLAYLGRWLPAALALVVLAMPAAILLWRFA